MQKDVKHYNIKEMISIIIPCYNRSKVIHRALDSVLAQRYNHWECIIVDDSSTDNTETAVLPYINSDSRFFYLTNQRNKGAQGARNTGLLKAKGEWILFFDSDNKMHPDFLQSVISVLENKEVDICSVWSNVIDDQTGDRVSAFKWSGFGDVYNQLLTGKSYFDNSSTVIRKQLLFEVGLLDELCPAFQEWDTHIRLSKVATYYTVEKRMVDYYIGAADAISSNSIKDIKGYLFILNKYKEEWIRYHRWSFLKYCSILRMKLIGTSVDNDIKKDYRRLLCLPSRFLVATLAFILFIKFRLRYGR